MEQFIKKIPFIKWISTSEGMMTMLRLLTFLIFPLIVWREDNIYLWYIGGQIAVFGLIIMIKMIKVFLKRKEFKTMLNGEKGGLVTDDLYSFSRHPFYLGFAILYLGLILSCFSFTALLFYGAYINFTFLTIFEEEKRMLKEFPYEYQIYKKEVHRFWPYDWKGLIKHLKQKMKNKI